MIGYLCCTDNMPSGSAFKLGDVLTIRNGKTVEIHNTDAEGRLVLADGLSLAAEEKPDAVLDIATLTGAVMGALGTEVAGVMGNDEALIDQVEAAAKRTDEKVWQLPLPAEYRKLLDSDVADMKNVGGPYGGALVAGLFLQEFVDGIPWAHLDIAGVMRSESDDGLAVQGRDRLRRAAPHRPPLRVQEGHGRRRTGPTGSPVHGAAGGWLTPGSAPSLALPSRSGKSARRP